MSSNSIAKPFDNREQFNLVIVGHVDHGKSTVIGRLLSDTNSLPDGKLEAVRERCRRNSKPFEYAFLLDALKDEQEQGITIDSARCFFKSGNRDYIITDAPGHVEFLRNMITGASRADAALLVIDAAEGVMENSRRHGFILSLLGIRQVSVLVNKMDLVKYDLKVLEKIKEEFGAFLEKIGVKPASFIPICAREGENIVRRAEWHDGKTVLEQINDFSAHEELDNKPFRLPIQGVYKFTEEDDQRRIFAGNVETGTASIGDDVIFYPSKKKTKIESIEVFSAKEKKTISAGEAVGVTLADELYVRPGEIMTKSSDISPRVGTRLRVQLFWMGRSPMIKGKRYKLKIASSRTSTFLSSIEKVLDASDFSMSFAKSQIDRHDVATCVIESIRPISFDLPTEIAGTGRLVIVDRYEIAGAGIVLGGAMDSKSIFDEHVEKREERWETSELTSEQRALRFGHKPKFILITGRNEERSKRIGMMLEARLFDEDYHVYYLGIANLDYGMDQDVEEKEEERAERIRRLGELSRIMTDSGQIFITAIGELDPHEIRIIRKLNAPGEILVVSLSQDSDTVSEADINLNENDDEVNSIRKICERLSIEKVIEDYVI